jgi:CheY-like chemotaxis protein
MLMVILPSLELLRSVVPTTHAPIVRDASDAAQRAAAMVRQLMSFAGQRRSGRVQAQSVGDMVRAAVRMCRSTFDRHIELAVTVADVTPTISCDPGGVEQVLMNVLLNARDAVMDAGRSVPKIEVEVDNLVVDVPPIADPTPGRYVRIQVSDDGAGMPDAVREKIFEPFFTTKGLAGGTGLGLASSYAIVRAHGGWIDCESTVGVGTRLSIMLPARAQPHSESQPSPEEVEAPASQPGRCVLVVDDEDAVRRLVCTALEGGGYQALAASSAKEALELVLLDRSMPGAPGHTLPPLLRQELPGCKIVYFTGQAVSAEERAEVDDVVAKPVTMEALLAKIADALLVL